MFSKNNKEEINDFLEGLQLMYCAVGLQVSYLTWGLLQEKIMTKDYMVSKLQGSKGIRQWPINLCTTPMMIQNLITPSVYLN